MDAAIRLPPELWFRIIHVCILELNTSDFNDWNKLPTPYSAPTLRKSAADLSRVCSSWRDLILSDHQFKVLKIKLFRFGPPVAEQMVNDTMLVALHKLPALITDPPTVRDQIMRFATRLQALSIYSVNSDEVLVAFEALKEAPFDHLVFLELGWSPGVPFFDLAPTHNLSQIRAPFLTHLTFRSINIFRTGTKDFSAFIRVIQDLKHLQHLDLRHFARYGDITQFPAYAPPDSLQSEVVFLTSLILDDWSDHIVHLLRYVTLPHLKTLNLRIGDWTRTEPDEGWYLPGFDFPKLHLMQVSLMNLSIARFLSYSYLPVLERLIVGPAPLIKSSYIPSQTRFLPINMPKLASLTFGLLSGCGGVPFPEFWSKTTSIAPISLCLNATEEVSGSDLDSFILYASAFDNVRSLAIPIHSKAMKCLSSGKLDMICAAFSRVDNLELFLHVKDDNNRIEFLTPSAYRSNVPGYGKIEVLPSLNSLSLFILADKDVSIPVIKKCAKVESYVKARSSAGKRLSRLVFNCPLAPNALNRIQKYVDQVVIEQIGWERIYRMTGQKAWPVPDGYRGGDVCKEPERRIAEPQAARPRSYPIGDILAHWFKSSN